MLRMRYGLRAGFFLMGILLLTVEPLSGQPGGGRKGGGGQGGGGFGGGGGSRDPEQAFKLLSAGTDTIDFTRMDANQKVFAKSIIERLGMPSPSDNTIITYAQFFDSFSRAQAKGGGFGGQPMGGGGFGGPPGGLGGPPGGGFGGGRGGLGGPPGGGLGGPPGGGFGGPPGGGFGGPPGGGFGGPPGGGFGGPPGGGFGGPPGGGRGGFGGGGGDMRGQPMGGYGPGGAAFQFQGGDGFRMTDQDIEKKFNLADQNRDGKLSYDEIPDRSSLKEKGEESFKAADLDRDGYISMAEYKAFIAARFGAEGDAGTSFGSYGGNGNYGRDEKKQEELPVAIRYGKLPVGLPTWWEALDTDKDGQIGLYEWRADGRDMKKFQEMDLDGDGLLAPQEWQRYNLQQTELAKAVAAAEEIDGTSTAPKGGRAPGGGGFGTMSGGAGPGGGKGDKGGDTNKGGDAKTPFREGGKRGKN